MSAHYINSNNRVFERRRKSFHTRTHTPTLEGRKNQLKGEQIKKTILFIPLKLTITVGHPPAVLAW